MKVKGLSVSPRQDEPPTSGPVTKKGLSVPTQKLPKGK